MYSHVIKIVCVSSLCSEMGVRCLIHRNIIYFAYNLQNICKGLAVFTLESDERCDYPFW